jgi:PPOX class probable F420-dependent enzyme
VVTFKRSGEPVPTVVNFGLSDQGTLLFRTEADSTKVKRIRRDPHVRLWSANLRGKPLGPATEGTARILPETEVERAYRVIRANWRPEMLLLERALDLMPVPLAYVEVVPGGPS